MMKLFKTNTGYMIFVVVIIAALTIPVSIFSQFTGARVIHFNYTQDPDNLAQAYRQDFLWQLSRPLSPTQDFAVTDYIDFQPEIPGTTRLLGNVLQFLPSQPLKYDQTYSVKLNPDLEDVYGNKITSWQTEFRTKPQRFIYQEEVGDMSSANLVLASLQEGSIKNKKTIAESVHLRDVAINYSGSKIAYSLQPEILEASEVYIYYVYTGENSKLDLGNWQVESLSFDQYSDLYFLGTIPDSAFLDLPESELPEFSTKPYFYDFETRETSELTALKPYYGNIVRFKLQSGGQFALVTQYSSDNDLVILPSGSPSPIGQFANFDKISYSGDIAAGQKVDFTQERFVPRAVIVDQEGVAFDSGEEAYIKDLEINETASLLAYSEKTTVGAEFAEGIFNLKIIAWRANQTMATLDERDSYSMELPSFNIDSSHIAVERIARGLLNQSSRRPRAYINPGRPRADILIYAWQDNAFGNPLIIEKSYNLTWVY